jgi:hypothetical protein
VKPRRCDAHVEACSEFVNEMRAAFDKRVQATTSAEKRDADLAMEEIMRRHLTAKGRREAAEVAAGDRKLAAAGKD